MGNTTGNQVRALILLSGSMDSILAACMLQEQGVDLSALVYCTPWHGAERARDAAALLDIPLQEVDFTANLVQVIERAGAIDDPAIQLALEVHGEMLQDALGRLGEMDAAFVATGDILDQRPANQSRQALDWLADILDGEDRILRPLSAQHLDRSGPEREGWLVREELGSFRGDDRDNLRALADRYGIEPPASEPHRLEDPAFAQRIQDLRAHEGLRNIGRRDLHLLTIGHHFRLGPVTKLVVARREEERRVLEQAAELYDLVVTLEDISGPTGLLPILATDDQIRTAASICARLSEVAEDGVAPVRVRSSRESRHLEVPPLQQDHLTRLQV